MTFFLFKMTSFRFSNRSGFLFKTKWHNSGMFSVWWTSYSQILSRPSSGKFSSLFWSISTFLNNMFSSILFYFLIVRQLSSQGILKKSTWRNSFDILKYERVILCVCVKLFLIFILCWIISLLAVLLVSGDSKVIQLYINIYPFFLKFYFHLCY